MKNIKRPEIVLVGIVAAIIAVGGIFYGLHAHNHQVTPSVPTETSKGYVNLNPPTQQDKNYNNSLKKAPTTQQSNNNTTSGSKQQVTPIISTHAETNTDLEVNGFVEGVVESNGTCTLRLKLNGVTVTQSKQGLANATNTTCGKISVPLSKLSAGNWTTTLEYSSTTSQGSSQAQDIAVK